MMRLYNSLRKGYSWEENTVRLMLKALFNTSLLSAIWDSRINRPPAFGSDSATFSGLFTSSYFAGYSRFNVVVNSRGLPKSTGYRRDVDLNGFSLSFSIKNGLNK